MVNTNLMAAEYEVKAYSTKYNSTSIDPAVHVFVTKLSRAS